MNYKKNIFFQSLDKNGWRYVTLTFFLSIIPYFFIIKAKDSDSPFTLLLMWIPAISAIILRLFNRESIFKGNIWSPLKDWKWIFIAALIPLFIEITTLVLTLSFGAATLKDGFISLENGNITIRGVAMIFGAASQPWYLFILNYLASYIVGVLFYSLLFAFGEEYGWRGYLQNKWAKNNEFKGYVIIGVIWGLWHLPAILMGHNYPEYPILGGFFLMPLLCFIFSIVFGIAKNRENVIWVAVVFHGALNISADVSNTAFLETSLYRPINDFIWTSLWAITAIIFWLKVNMQN